MKDISNNSSCQKLEGKYYERYCQLKAAGKQLFLPEVGGKVPMYERCIPITLLASFPGHMGMRLIIPLLLVGKADAMWV